jgi:hypothetical protein
MDEQRMMLRHFLAALAYRTQKALRDAPPEFAEFRVAPLVRTPHELIRHMDGVLGSARSYFTGEAYSVPYFPEFSDAVAHFHETLADLAHHLETGTELREITLERVLQGPCCDALSHAGQFGDAEAAGGLCGAAGELYLCRRQRGEPWPGAAASGSAR